MATSSDAHHSGLIYDTSAWLAVSFVIFAFIIYKTAGKFIVNALDARSEKIKKDIEAAETLHVEAQQLLAQYQRKQRDAQKEADMILDNAKKNAYEIRKTAERELKESIALKEQQLQDRIDRMKDNAIADIRSHAANLATAATKHIIEDGMTKSQAGKLIDHSLDELKKLH